METLSRIVFIDELFLFFYIDWLARLHLGLFRTFIK